jgi:type I restriction enzyme S subunit
MNAIQQLLTEHFDIWTGAEAAKRSGRGRSSSNAASVYGIKKLRELILELAVRGKLVPQDANDQPASELLKRIQAEKAKLVAEGKIKKEKPLAPIDENEKPYELPQSWYWIRLGYLGEWGAGATPLRSVSSYYGGDMPWFKSGELSSDFIDTAEETVTELALKECSLRLNNPGDVLIAMYGATIGKAAILKVVATTNQAVCACTPNLSIFNRYLLLLLKAMKSNFIGQGAGGAQPNISREKIIATIAALPPLAEQHRIVAKVDELMALCDQLEAQQNNAAQAHEKLVSHLLGTLTQSQNAEDFSANWQRIAVHFDTLFTTEASIDALKQTLLQLAVMGKLVPQDVNDEPASKLLKRIQAEKAKLIAEGKLKKEKLLAPISEDEKPFELPNGWEWIRLGSLGDWGAGATPLRSISSYYGGDMPWFKSGELSSDFIDVAEETITEQALKECSLRLNQPGDVLIAMYGATIGKASILKIPATTNQAVCACTPNGSIFNRYLLVLLKAMKSNFIGQGAGGAQPNISREKIIATTAALPPLSEQHRIVAKVDELMALCDQLKTRIQQAGQQQQLLADVLVARAVA